MSTPQNRIYRVCAQCSKTFIGWPSDIKYGKGTFCSRACRFPDAALGPVHRICAQCSKAFSVDPSVFKKGGGKFCSKECCSASYTVEPVQRVCAHCHGSFSVKPSVAKGGGGIFCSKKCHYASGALGIVSRVCVQCSKAFGIRVARLNDNKGILCSKACRLANQMARAVPPEIRFWKYVTKTEGCWLWSGSGCKGYGVIGIASGVAMYAHRFSWEIHNGPITDGLFVLHHCDTPACVRPDHLFLGTDEDNSRDRVQKRRGNVRLIEAFGETKAVTEWLEDPRCRTARNNIVYRVRMGFSAERSISTSTDEWVRKPRRLEEKDISESILL